MRVTRQRMVHPQIASDLRLRPLPKRCLYIAAMMLAEDSGCLVWDAQDLWNAALPLEQDLSREDVQGYMDGLEEDGYAWTYVAQGLKCAFLPAFPEWQRSMTRWNASQSVPLPPGITYQPIETANRYGSGTYTWPKSKEEMLRCSDNHPSTQASVLPSKPFTQGAAGSLRTAPEQPASSSEDDDLCVECGSTGFKPNGEPCHWCPPERATTKTGEDR